VILKLAFTIRKQK